MALLDVVGKAGDGPLLLLGGGGGGEELADGIEKPGVRGQRGARRAADGLLGNLHHARDLVEALVCADRPAGFLLVIAHGGGGAAQETGEHGGDERRLARARHTGNGGELAESKVNVKFLDAAAVDAVEGELAVSVAGRGVELELAGVQGAGGGGLGSIGVDGAGVEDLAAGLACERADVDEPIGLRDQVHVVLDEEDGVAGGEEAAADIHDGGALLGVETGRRLVEYIGDAEEPGAQLGGQAQALELAGRERRRGTIET